MFQVVFLPPGVDLLDGMLGDVRVYNRALCEEEVTELHGAGSPQGVRIQKWVEIQ